MDGARCHVAIESEVSIIEARSSERRVFAEPANPTDDEMDAIGRTPFQLVPEGSGFEYN